MKVLVTGGAGFIGHHLVNALIARGDDVAILDDFSTGTRDRVAGSGASRIVEGDLRTSVSLLDALHGCEVVFHEAAIVSVVRSVITYPVHQGLEAGLVRGRVPSRWTARHERPGTRRQHHHRHPRRTRRLEPTGGTGPGA